MWAYALKKMGFEKLMFMSYKDTYNYSDIRYHI